MASPLTLAAFIGRSIMPGDDIADLQARETGYLQKRLDGNWSWIQARLAKRYDVVAMALELPEIVAIWLTNLTTKDAYDKRGYNPESASDRAAILDAYTEAKAEIKEAADSQAGLFDLPLKASTAATSGVTRGGPIGYSETSPYVFTDAQACEGMYEDRNGTGTVR